MFKINVEILKVIGLKTLWEIVRAERKNVVSKNLKILEHKNC